MIDDENDEKLCQRARAGDEQAFECLFRRYYDAIHAFVFRLSLDAGSVDDLAQETFIKAARSLDHFRGDAAFRNWLFRIATNTVRDWQRASIRERVAKEELAGSVGVDVRNPDFALVHDALAGLGDDLRQTVVLVFYEGFSHAESARILGCAETTVSWRIFRAKRQLKKLLSANGGSL